MHTCDDQGSAWGPCAGQVVPQTDFCATAVDDDCSGSALDCVGSAPWSKSIGGPGNDAPVGLAIDAAGNALWAGYCNTPFDVGGGVLPGGHCCGKLDGTGAHVWSKSFTISWPGDIAVDASGSFLWAGAFLQPVDFGGGALFTPSSMSDETFVVKFAAFANKNAAAELTATALSSTGPITVMGTDAGTVVGQGLGRMRVFLSVNTSCRVKIWATGRDA